MDDNLSLLYDKPMPLGRAHAAQSTATRNETFIEFTFEAAHLTAPYGGLHGHSFRVEIFLKGRPDPVYGWSHNLLEVAQTLAELRSRIDHKYLNDIPGLEVPSLENLARWLWCSLNSQIPGVDRVIVRRGYDGQIEGCCYAGEG